MNAGHARILILSSGPACRNPRPHKEACALQAAGHSVTLLCPAFNADQARQDETLAHEGGYARLVLPSYTSLSSRAVTWLARRLAAHGWPTMRALGPYQHLQAAALAHQADLTIVHTELPLLIGTRLLRQGHLVAADFEDWHSEDLLPCARRQRPLARLRSVEACMLRQAAYCSTTSEALSAALQLRHGGRAASVITNSFPLQPEPDPFLHHAPPSLFWYSQTLGPGRGLEPFLRAWAADTNDSRLVLLGEPISGYPDHLRSLLPRPKRERLELLGLVSPQALPELIARHDLGLALEESSPESRRLTITNKILQYLNAGLAVLASDTAGQQEVFARTPGIGALVQLNSTASIAQALSTLLSSPETLHRARLQARALARSHYNWEREAERLQQLVATALRRRAQPSSPA
jgi:glycosyltransferase involved in cell wall biosynthesis